MFDFGVHPHKEVYQIPLLLFVLAHVLLKLLGGQDHRVGHQMGVVLVDLEELDSTLVCVIVLRGLLYELQLVERDEDGLVWLQDTGVVHHQGNPKLLEGHVQSRQNSCHIGCFRVLD